MGIFDFFKRKDKKCIECGSLIVGNHKICSSCTPEAKIAAAKAKKRSSEKFKKLKDVNLKITEIYQAFKKKIKETDDGTGESLNYWYDIVKNMASQYPLKEDSSFDLQIKEFVYGNYDEYKRRDDLIGATDEGLENFARMRIFSFGEIYSQLTLLEKKINKLLSDNSIKKHKISVQLNNELARAKARTYGAIKYALSVNISKNKIKEWFPAFVDDKELIEGVNPFDTIAEKYNIDMPSSTPQYELSEDEKNNIPDWYTGDVDEEGSIIKDEETGKEIKLTALETSIYNVTKMNKMLVGQLQKDRGSGKDGADKINLQDSTIYQDMMIQLEQGKLWLKENNIEAYKVLFGELEEDGREELSCWRIIDSDDEEYMMWLLRDGCFKYKNIKTEYNQGDFYDDKEDTWIIEGDKITISFSNGFRIMKGNLNSERTFIEGTWSNNHEDSGTWNGEKISHVGEIEEDDNPWTNPDEDTNQSLQDLVIDYFMKTPLNLSYYIWLKEDDKDNKLKKDGLSVNIENKLALRYLCMQSIVTESGFEDADKKQVEYFMNLDRVYNCDELDKEKSLFRAKKDKGKIDGGNRYLEKIIRSLSDYNKLVFIYTIYDLLYINHYLNHGNDGVGFDKEINTGDPSPAIWLEDILIDEGLFQEFKNIGKDKFEGANGVFAIMITRTQIKLKQKEHITSFGSNLEEREKDAVFYFLLNFIMRKRNSDKAFAEYRHIVSLLNYDSDRVELNEDGSLSDKFISEDDALDWLLNIDEASKEMFEMLVKMIITSDLHYSIKEEFYLNNLINDAKLPGMHADEKIHSWLLSICDTDREDAFKDLFDKMKKDAEKKDKIEKKIENEKDLKKQEELIKSAIKKYPEEWRWHNSYCYNLYDQQKFLEGIKVIQKVIDKNPEESMYYDTCAMGYYYLEDYNKALELMTKGIKLDLKGEKCYINEHYYNRGNVLVKMDNIKDAKKDFKAALDFNNPYFKEYGTPSLKKAMKKMVTDALEKL